MYSYLKRHEVDLESSTSYNDGCGKLMFDSWGGKAAMRWSASKLKELGLLDILACAEFETSVSVGSSYAGQFGNPKKRK
jgi:hypothetical protein